MKLHFRNGHVYFLEQPEDGDGEPTLKGIKIGVNTDDGGGAATVNLDDAEAIGVDEGGEFQSILEALTE